MQLLKHFTFSEELLTTWSENADHIVNFDSLIQYTRHQVNTISGPFHTNRAVGFGLADLNLLIKGPEVDLTSQITKASDHRDLRKWTHSDRVSESLTEFK